MFESSRTATYVVPLFLIIALLTLARDLNHDHSNQPQVGAYAAESFSSAQVALSLNHSRVTQALESNLSTLPTIYSRQNEFDHEKHIWQAAPPAQNNNGKWRQLDGALATPQSASIASPPDDQMGRSNCSKTKLNSDSAIAQASSQNNGVYLSSDSTARVTERDRLYNEMNQLTNQQIQAQEKQVSSVFSISRKGTGVVRVFVKRAAQDINADCEFHGSKKPTVYGLRCDDAEVTDDGTIIIRAFSPTRVYLIGRNLYSNLTIALTEQDGAPQDDCTHANRIKSFKLYNLSLNIGEIVVELAPPEKNVPYFFCIREDTPDARWYHQGSEAWLKIQVIQDLMPLWAKLIFIAVLLSSSGLFSGLNLGLMALDKNELQVIMKCGSDEEKRYATIIEPVRRRGNYLLCSILFSNTLVNSTISVLLEDLSDGLVAIMTSTVLIVLFGEILPQAFCSRHGLAVGAKTIWITNFCMFITFPLSYPVSYCLDWALGEEIGHAYDRERLMEFIRVTRDINNLEADEVNIISGALKIKRVQISEVMTRIEDVYMLDENALLDFDTIQAIVGKGYSRIPVHESGDRRNIKAVLFAKDLALVDPDDRTPVQTMINFYDHPRMFVFEDTTLDKALNEFKTGKSHMAIVQRICDDGERDPYYEVTGIVTLEDVIEEIMQMEINDETDTLTDNRRKRRRKDAQVRKDFSQFTNLGTGDSSFNVVTPQLCLAAYQYLATTVEPFTPRHLSDSILRRLLSQKIFYKVRLEEDESLKRLYTAGEPADYFIMILEGRVHVTCGKENLIFDGGPFSFFGKAALTNLDQNEALMTAAAAVGIANVAASSVASPSTPGGTGQSSLSAGLGGGGGGPRRDSSRPQMSRRESLAKIVTSQLSLASKKVADVEQTLVPNANTDLSPTGSAGANVHETVELLERGSYYFKPDYTVDVIANTSYLKVTRNDYITALRATCVERESAAMIDEDAGGGGHDSTMFMSSNQMLSSLVVEESGQHESPA